MKNLEVDYGHWMVAEQVDLRDYLGFTYLMEFENGKKYIGAKKIWRRIKQSPSEFKRGPRRGFEQSDWRTYMTSSNDIAGMILDDVKIKRMVITGWFHNWGSTLYAEAAQQFENRVLFDDSWLNYHIEGHFVKSKDDRPVIKSLNLLKQLQSDESVVLYRTTISIDSNILGFHFTNEDGSVDLLGNKSITEFIKSHNVSQDSIIKLLNGSIHCIDDRIWLPKKYRIVTNVVKHKPSNMEFRIFKEAQEHFKITKKEIETSNDFEIMKPELKSEFQKRLKNMLPYSLKLEILR